MRLTTGAKLFVALLVAGLFVSIAALDLWQPHWPQLPAVVIISSAQGAEPQRNASIDSNASPAPAPPDAAPSYYLLSADEVSELKAIMKRAKALILKQQEEIERLRREASGACL